MFFRDIIGQEDIKKYLVETVRQGVVPHARLFCGDEGTGVFQLALAYARYLNCTERGETDACGHCKACLQYDELSHPDLHFVFPMVQNREAKKMVCDDYMQEWRQFLQRNIEGHTYFGIDDWLEFIGAGNKQFMIYSEESGKILHKMNFRIYEAQYRVLLVWMPERMNLNCSNKLLKIIEEPPSNTAILMVTYNPDRILGTIVSRSQLLRMKPIPSDVLTQSLIDILKTNGDDARNIAHISGGSYLKAVRMLAVSKQDELFLEKFKQIMRNGWKRDIVAMKAFAEEMAQLGREQQKNFLAFAQRQVRENFVHRLQESEMNFMTNAEADFAKNFSPYVNERNVVDLMEELSLATAHIAQNVYSKMVFFDLSMRITVLVRR